MWGVCTGQIPTLFSRPELMSSDSEEETKGGGRGGGRGGLPAHQIELNTVEELGRCVEDTVATAEAVPDGKTKAKAALLSLLAAEFIDRGTLSHRDEGRTSPSDIVRTQVMAPLLSLQAGARDSGHPCVRGDPRSWAARVEWLLIKYAGLLLDLQILTDRSFEAMLAMRQDLGERCRIEKPHRLTAGYTMNGRAFTPYVAEIEKAFPGVRCAHVGLSGWTTSQMVDAIDAKAVNCVCARTWPGLRAALALPAATARDNSKNVAAAAAEGAAGSPSTTAAAVTTPLYVFDRAWRCDYCTLENRKIDRVCAGCGRACPAPATSKWAGPVAAGPRPLALIMAGTNDLGDDGISAAGVVANLKKLHEAAHDCGWCTVALSVPEHGQEGVVPSVKNKRLEINASLRAFVEDEASPAVSRCLAFVDSAAMMPYSSGNGRWDDPLHLTATGYKELGERIAEALVDQGLLW
eukprot:g70.t1